MLIFTAVLNSPAETSDTAMIFILSLTSAHFCWSATWLPPRFKENQIYARRFLADKVKKPDSSGFLFMAVYSVPHFYSISKHWRKSDAFAALGGNPLWPLPHNFLALVSWAMLNRLRLEETPWPLVRAFSMFLYITRLKHKSEKIVKGLRTNSWTKF